MEIIKNILVPIDFSVSSERALQYALSVAEGLNAAVRIVNIYNAEKAFKEPAFAHAGYDEIQNFVVSRMKEFVEFETDYPPVATKSRIRIKIEAKAGRDISTEIVDLTKQPDVDLIIMGATGEHNAIDKIIGSVANSVSQRAFCPVMLVPENSVFMNINAMLYTCHDDSMHEPSLSKFFYLAKRFNSAMHFVHVDNQSGQMTVPNESFFKEAVEKNATGLTYFMKSVQGENVMSAIYDYAQDNDVDLIVFVTEHRDFWANLLAKSTTRSFLWNVKRPLLIMHLDDKNHIRL
jgi:nucleotide-binding universal stress UspA family protein